MIATKYLLVLFLFSGHNYSSADNAGGMTIIDKDVFLSKAACQEAASIVTKETSQVGYECIPWDLEERKS